MNECRLIRFRIRSNKIASFGRAVTFSNHTATQPLHSAYYQASRSNKTLFRGGGGGEGSGVLQPRGTTNLLCLKKVSIIGRRAEQIAATHAYQIMGSEGGSTQLLDNFCDFSKNKTAILAAFGQISHLFGPISED